MKLMIRTLVMLALVMIASLVIARESQEQRDKQEKRDAPQIPQMSIDELMKMAEQMAAPVEQHKRLARFEGEWKVTGNSFFMPGQPPVPFTGTSRNTMILGGRFLQVEGEYESKQPPMKMQSLTVYGFDKRTGKYTLWGADTLGTYTVSADGDDDEGSDSITTSGEIDDAGAARKMAYKFVLTFVDDRHYRLELHMDYPGIGWHKQMEATHEKAASSGR